MGYGAKDRTLYEPRNIVFLSFLYFLPTKMKIVCIKIFCIAFSIVPAFCDGIFDEDSQLIISIQKLDPKTGPDADAVLIAGTDGDNGKPILQLVAKALETDDETRPIIPKNALSTTGNTISEHPVSKHLIIPAESSEEQVFSLILDTALKNEKRNLENAHVEYIALSRELDRNQLRQLLSKQPKKADSAKNTEKNAAHKRNYSTWLLAPPYVDVTISHPKNDNATYTENVAVSPDMTVSDAMIQATLSYSERSGSDVDIPFDVLFDWDDADDCFVIKRALGKKSRRRAGWSITVKNMFQKEVYSGRCIPFDEIILRPFSSVSVTYQRHQKRMRQKS